MGVFNTNISAWSFRGFVPRVTRFPGLTSGVFVTPLKTWKANQPCEDVSSIQNSVIFQLVMLVFRGVYVYIYTHIYILDYII